jgi:flagellar protein FliS
MNTLPRGAAAYRKIEAQSRSPIELVVMLYDGALRFVGEAQAAAARNDIPARGEAISRAIAIVSELQNTLQIDEGGDIARELDRLYSYINRRLLDVSAKRDFKALDEVQKLLATLREGWSQAAGASR